MQQSNQPQSQIMIIDSHPIVREGYSRLIERQQGLQVCAESDGKEEAIRQIGLVSPDLIIVGITLKDGNGLDLIKEIKSQFDQIRFLVVSMHDEILFAEKAIRAGALGYLNKQATADQILKAIYRVLDGKVYLSPAITERMICRSIGSDNHSDLSPVESLSAREFEVFKQIGSGATTRQIAQKLQLSSKTVETYRENIKLKLNLKNATELSLHATQWALENQ